MGREFVDSAGTKLLNVHSPRDCAGRGCAIHGASDHHMRDWDLVWVHTNKRVRGHMTRVCPHGQRHPDPDDAAFWRTQGVDVSKHKCDGCCDPEQAPDGFELRWCALCKAFTQPRQYYEDGVEGRIDMCGVCNRRYEVSEAVAKQEATAKEPCESCGNPLHGYVSWERRLCRYCDGQAE